MAGAVNPLGLSFQLILNPIRDWNNENNIRQLALEVIKFQLILNPIRDWNWRNTKQNQCYDDVPINLKPY